MEITSTLLNEYKECTPAFALCSCKFAFPTGSRLQSSCPLSCTCTIAFGQGSLSLLLKPEAAEELSLTPQRSLKSPSPFGFLFLSHWWLTCTTAPRSRAQPFSAWAVVIHILKWCMLCSGRWLSFILQTWDLSVLSLLTLCSCGTLHLDQTPPISLRSLRPGFRCFDSSAESVDVAHYFGTSCLSANPCHRLQGFADVLPSHPAASQNTGDSHWRYLNYPSSILMEMGSRTIKSVDLSVSLGHECLTGE